MRKAVISQKDIPVDSSTERRPGSGAVAGRRGWATSRKSDACRGVGHSEARHDQETCLTGRSMFQNVI